MAAHGNRRPMGQVHACPSTCCPICARVTSLALAKWIGGCVQHLHNPNGGCSSARQCTNYAITFNSSTRKLGVRRRRVRLQQQQRWRKINCGLALRVWSHLRCGCLAEGGREGGGSVFYQISRVSRLSHRITGQPVDHRRSRAGLHLIVSIHPSVHCTGRDDRVPARGAQPTSAASSALFVQGMAACVCGPLGDASLYGRVRQVSKSINKLTVH